MVASLCMFNNSKIVFRAEQYQSQNMHMRIFQKLLFVVPASFKLAPMCCSCMHLLPWVALYSLFMHHNWLSIMPCSCVVCLPCCVLLLDSSRFVAIVRIRSSTCGLSSWLYILHGLVLIPCGISGKMTATLDLTTVIAMLVASFYRYDALPIICSSSLPNCHEPLTFVTLPSKPLFGYVTAFAQPLL